MELSKRCQIVAGDTPFHGKSVSSFIPNEYSMEQFAGDWHSLINHLGVNNAFVLGAGLGSAIALQLVLDHPEAIQGLILVNAWSHCDDDFTIWLRKWIRIVRKDGVEALTKFIIPHFFPKDFIRAKPEVIEHFRRLRREQRPETVILACKACMRFDIRDRLTEIRVPVLLIIGEYALLAPPFKSKFILEKVGRAKYVKVEGCGHMPFLERPTEFNRIVSTFIDNVHDH